jgi:hypothetical protein
LEIDFTVVFLVIIEDISCLIFEIQKYIYTFMMSNQLNLIMMKKIYLLGIVLAMFVLGNCKKDSNPSKTEMLTGKSWMVTAWTVDPAYPINGTTVTNWYAQMDACEKDDIVNFKSGGTYTIEEGATKCYDGDPQVYETGTWTFNSDETIIVMTPNGDTPVSCTIVSLSSNTLKISYQETDNYIKYTDTKTLTAK